MMRSRSREPRNRQSNFTRSRSRSPYYARSGNKLNNFSGEKIPPFRNNYGGRQTGLYDRRRGDELRSPRRSPMPYKRRSRSPHRHDDLQDRLRKEPLDSDHHRRERSPLSYSDRMYQRSPSPQRLTTEPISQERSLFLGPEGTLIDLNELKKITVDIRRNLPRNSVVSHGPLKYAFNPADFVLIRRPGEGSRPIFDREELKPRPVEERVIKLSTDMLPDRMESQQSRPRSRESHAVPSGFQQQHLHHQELQQEGRSMDEDGEGDLRFRLMEKKSSSDEIKERMNADPNFVPQGRYYYEHDNRDKFSRGRGHSFRGGYNRGNFHQNQQSGGYRANYRGGGGNQYGRDQSFRGHSRGKMRSPDWQHDLYNDAIIADDGKPSSTTQI